MEVAMRSRMSCLCSDLMLIVLESLKDEWNCKEINLDI